MKKKKRKKAKDKEDNPISLLRGCFLFLRLTLFTRDSFLSKHNLHDRLCLLENTIKRLEGDIKLLIDCFMQESKEFENLLLLLAKKLKEMANEKKKEKD